MTRIKPPVCGDGHYPFSPHKEDLFSTGGDIFCARVHRRRFLDFALAIVFNVLFFFFEWPLRPGYVIFPPFLLRSAFSPLLAFFLFSLKVALPNTRTTLVGFSGLHSPLFWGLPLIFVFFPLAQPPRPSRLPYPEMRFDFSSSFSSLLFVRYPFFFCLGNT